MKLGLAVQPVILEDLFEAPLAPRVLMETREPSLSRPLWSRILDCAESGNREGLA